MIFCYDTDALTVEFLGERRIDVIGAKTCLNVPDGDALVKRGKRGNEGGRRIAVQTN